MFDYLIIAGGLNPPKAFLRKILKVSKKVVTVDSGVHAIAGLGVRPILHVGDDDSAKESLIKKARPLSRISLPVKKAISDLEYVLQELPKNSLKIVLGAHKDRDGRPDHGFANLVSAPSHHPIIFTDEKLWIASLAPGKTFTFTVPKKTLFSIVGLNKGKLTVRGSYYDVKQRLLETASLGLSNLSRQKRVTIKNQRPALLFVKASIFQSQLKLT